MSEMIFSTGMKRAELQCLLQALPQGSSIKEFEDIPSLKQFLRDNAHEGAVLVIGAECPAKEVIDAFSWAHLYTPHLQCLLLIEQGDVERLIDIKNRISAFAVAQMPADNVLLKNQMERLVARARVALDEERFLRKPLATGLLNVRQIRTTTLFQLLGASPDGGIEGGLLSYLEAATIVQQDSVTKGLASDHDLFSHVKTEARRMSTILANVREWHTTFEKGESVRSFVDIFKMVGDDLVVRDILAQLTPINGPIGLDPSPKECCLLALLTRPRSRAWLAQTAESQWLVATSAPETPTSNLKALLA